MLEGVRRLVDISGLGIKYHEISCVSRMTSAAFSVTVSFVTCMLLCLFVRVGLRVVNGSLSYLGVVSLRLLTCSVVSLAFCW